MLLESDWTPQAENTGYLASLEDGPAGVTGFAEALRRLPSVVAALRAGGGLLVLTGGHDLTLLLRGPGGAAIATHALRPVDPLAVLERRVLGHAEDPESRTALRALVETTGAARALREQPAARHAARLASVIRAGGDVAAEAAALRDPSDQVRDWFDRYREPEALAFALAAATLEGSGYLTVSEAAVKLCRALTPPEPAAVDLRFRDRVGFDQQWIQLVPDGSGPPRVRFRSALLGQVILRYAWTSLDGWREAVLAWLRQLLSHSDLEVRARAAVAAGVLASADHHYAVHRFLTSWAGAASWPLRQAAATALGVAGSRPETSEAVWELLDGWARGGSSAQQRRLAGTAANAVGGILGREAPERAVAVLRAALDRGDDWGPCRRSPGAASTSSTRGRPARCWMPCWSGPSRRTSPPWSSSPCPPSLAASRPYERTADGPVAAVPGVPLLLSGPPARRPARGAVGARAGAAPAPGDGARGPARVGSTPTATSARAPSTPWGRSSSTSRAGPARAADGCFGGWRSGRATGSGHRRTRRCCAGGSSAAHERTPHTTSREEHGGGTDIRSGAAQRGSAQVAPDKSGAAARPRPRPGPGAGQRALPDGPQW